jgi:hypothetical protein
MTCNNTGLTGGKFCTTGNPEGVPTGFALAKDSFEMTAEDFLLKATLDTAVKAENFFPINGKKLFKGMENNNAEALIHEFGNRTRSFMDQKVLRVNFLLDPNEEQEKQLKKFHKANGLELYLFYGSIIRGRTPDSGTTVKGLRTTGVYVQTGDFNMPDGTKGTMMVSVDLMTEKDKSEYAYSREVVWDLFTLDGLTEVDLEQVSATASELIFNVYSESNGNQLPIPGLLAADFAMGAGSTGTLSEVAESATIPGQYTATTALMIDGDTINLVAPASISVAEYFIKSSGALIVAGIA